MESFSAKSIGLLRRKASATRPFLIAFLWLFLTNAVGICPHHDSLAFIAPSLRHCYFGRQQIHRYSKQRCEENVE